MEIMYNATGARRKELVKAVAAISGVKPVYLGTPSFSYKVGGIEVTRDGTLRLSDGRTAQPLTEALAKAGFPLRRGGCHEHGRRSRRRGGCR